MTSVQKNAPWQLLPWDSNYFGFLIARIDQSLTSNELSLFLNWHNEHRVRCTYYLCPIDNLEAIHAATSMGFQFVDVRVTLQHRIKELDSTNTEDTHIRAAHAEDVSRLEELASVLHQDTRFFADKHFPVDNVRKLYALWMRRDVEDPIGIVLVRADAENKPVGYLTCQIREGQGNIGLFGVADSHQGQGIGSALLQQGLRWFRGKGCQWVNVVTQGKNLAALASYTSRGFRIKTMSLWLHHWPRPVEQTLEVP